MQIRLDFASPPPSSFINFPHPLLFILSVFLEKGEIFLFFFVEYVDIPMIKFMTLKQKQNLFKSLLACLLVSNFQVFFLSKIYQYLKRMKKNSDLICNI